jgi:hypothetical protein
MDKSRYTRIIISASNCDNLTHSKYSILGYFFNIYENVRQGGISIK